MEACGGPGGAAAATTVVVGDFRFDVEAGRAAGVRTVALVPDPAPDWAALATWQARDLADVRAILAELLGAADEPGAGD
jgi:phosphoglycolate phosphatase